MKRTNRILSMLLAVIMVVCMLPVSVFAADSCICDTKCTDVANADCMVCSGDGAVLAEVCNGQTEQTTTYSVTVSQDGGGTITGEGSYAPGEEVTITATPDTANGYCAAGWGLAAVDGGLISPIHQKNSHTFTMPEKDVAISVTFEQHSHISHTNLGNGTHDIHCIYCGDVQTASEPCVDVHSGGDNATPDGWCDKCSTRIPGKSIVQFESNHESATGEVYGQIVDTGSSITLPVNGFTLEGYTFQGWSAAADGSGALYQVSDTYSVMADTTLYAIWQETAPAICTCENRCYLNQIDANCTVCTNSDFSGCMGTPELMENGDPIRLSEAEAEVYFMGSVNPNVIWKYFYIVTNETTAQPTASEIIAGGASGDYSDLYTLKIDNLTDGEKYIHIVLHQEEQNRTTNVLKLTIPEYVPLTITPSAEGYELESDNTLTVEVGTTVTFTTSESGCGMEYKENTTVGPELEFVGDEGYVRTGTFTELGTYTIVASIDYKTAECTVVVVDELHQHKYFSSWSKDASGHWHDCDCGATTDYAKHTSSGAASYGIPETCTVCRYEIAPALTGYTLTLNYNEDSTGVSVEPGSKTIIGLTPGEVVDLSKHWPADKTVAVGEKTYYFAGFEQNKGDAKVESPTVTVNSDLTLDANWTTTPMVSLTFETNNGTMPYAKVRVKMYTLVDAVSSIHMPVRSGYDFVGWSLENDGTADSGDSEITADCTLYAVWQSGSDEPPATDVPVKIGGDYDAILRDGMVIVQGEDPISGTLDLGKTDAEAIQLPYASVEKSAIERTEATILFPGGTSATLTGPAWTAAKDALKVGENLQISVKDVGAEVLPDSLTEKGAYGGSDVNIDKGFFVDAGITEERLTALGLINNSNDSSISEEEFEYLYHYLTTDELKALKTELNEGAHFEHHQNAVNWLTEMIERDATVVSMSNGQLNISGILSRLEAIGYTGSDFTLGFLRQADLDMEHLEYIRHLMQQFVDNFDDSADELVLAWANEAITQKEFEATCAQMDALLEEARNTQGSYTGLNDVKAAVKDMTNYELKLFLKKANAAKNTESGTIPVLALGAIDSIIKVLNSELEARGTTDVPTYINTSGTFDGINPLFIGAVDVNIGAVKVDGTTTPIAIKADRSDAVAWSTNVSSAALEEMLAMLGAATTEDVVSNIKAYKVLDNGTLEAKACKVIVNDDGTLTLSALSDGNSTYVFLYEPAKADVDDTPTTPETPDSPQTGDNSHMWLWFGLMLASGFALAGTWIYGRKRRTN